LFNFGNEDFEVSLGDRIAQFIIEKYTKTDLLEVDDLGSTMRGEGGFGSTGVHTMSIEKITEKTEEGLENGSAQKVKKLKTK